MAQIQVDPYEGSEAERTIEVSEEWVPIPWWVILLAIAGVATAIGIVVYSEATKPQLGGVSVSSRVSSVKSLQLSRRG